MCIISNLLGHIYTCRIYICVKMRIYTNTHVNTYVFENHFIPIFAVLRKSLDL